MQVKVKFFFSYRKIEKQSHFCDKSNGPIFKVNKWTCFRANYRDGKRKKPRTEQDSNPRPHEYFAHCIASLHRLFRDLLK